MYGCQMRWLGVVLFILACGEVKGTEEPPTEEPPTEGTPLMLSVSTAGAAEGVLAITADGAVVANCNLPCNQDFTVLAGANVNLTLTSSSGALAQRFDGECQSNTAACSFVMAKPSAVALAVSRFNYVFLTNSEFDGDLKGADADALRGADAKCQAAADAAKLPGEFVAWISTTTNNAVDRIVATGARGWIRPDGLPVGDTIGDGTSSTDMLFDGHVYYPPRVTELGNVTTSHAWTSTDDTGALVRTGDNCNNYSNASGANHGRLGAAFGGPTVWTDDSSASVSSRTCDRPHPIYCFGTTVNRPLTSADLPAIVGRRAFLSSPWDTVARPGLSGADGVCQADAAAASLPNPTRFKALLATTSASAASRFNTTTGAGWVRTDGVEVSATAADLMTSKLGSPIVVTADGKTYLSSAVHTGALTPRSVATNANCSDWSDNTSNFGGAKGTSGFGSAKFFDAGFSGTCQAGVRLYCLED